MKRKHMYALTAQYWQISNLWGQRPVNMPNMSTYEALLQLNKIIKEAPDDSRLYMLAYNLKMEIVRYDTKADVIKAKGVQNA